MELKGSVSSGTDVCSQLGGGRDYSQICKSLQVDAQMEDSSAEHP